jgi:hypothetical protein
MNLVDQVLVSAYGGSGYNFKHHAVIYHPLSGKLVVLFTQAFPSSVYKLYAAVVDGNVVGAITTSEILFKGTDLQNCCCLNGDNIIVFCPNSSAAEQIFVVVEVSGMTVTLTSTTAASVTATYGYDPSLVPLGSDKFALTVYPSTFICQENGDGTVTVGAAVAFPSTYPRGVYNDGYLLYVYPWYTEPDGYQLRYIVGTVSGMSVTYDSPGVIISNRFSDYGLDLVKTTEDNYILFADNLTTDVPTIFKISFASGVVAIGDSADTGLRGDGYVSSVCLASGGGMLGILFYDGERYPSTIGLNIYDITTLVKLEEYIIADVSTLNSNIDTTGQYGITYNSTDSKFSSVYLYDPGVAGTCYNLYLRDLETISAFWMNFNGQTELLI